MPVSTIQNASLASGVPSASNITTGTLPKAQLPSGSVLQVVQATKTDTQTFSGLSTSWADITGLSVSITPTSASSRILIMGTLMMAQNDNPAQMRIVRDSTPIFIGDAASNRKRATAQVYATSGNVITFVVSPCFVDSPNTLSALTYKFQYSIGGGATQYVNRTARDADASSEDARGASSIIVMEIAG
jgi:hypothetical protein